MSGQYYQIYDLSALLPANVEGRPPLQRGLMQISSFKISSYITSRQGDIEVLGKQN